MTQDSTTASRDMSLSVIMPAYNEEGSIEAAVGDVVEHILKRIPKSGLVVVNDGSRDNTGVILDRLDAEHDAVRVIHQQNGGHAAALMTGLSAADSDYVFLIDSDRQIPLDGFVDIWALLQEDYDGVFGVRRKRDDPQLRLLLTAVIRRVLQFLFREKIYDANIPFKLLRREIWERASALIPAETLAPSLFLAIYAYRAGYRIKEVDVPHSERATGEVSIRRFKLLKFCTRGFMQMLTFRKRLNHAF